MALVAESLGKPNAPGPMPYAARGPADQHSLLQRFLQGPDDAWALFLDVHSAGDPAGTFSAIRDAEREATAFAYAENERPFATLRLSDAGPAAVGALLMTWQIAVARAGELMGIDPFDQPAVELGKRIAADLVDGKRDVLGDFRFRP